MTAVRFTVPGDPVPKARPRVARGRAYTPAATRDAEARVALAYRQAAGAHDLDPDARYRVECHFRTATRRRVDIDNLIKTILDGLNGGAYHDDAQVIEVHATKTHAGKSARTVVVVERLTPAQIAAIEDAAREDAAARWGLTPEQYGAVMSLPPAWRDHLVSNRPDPLEEP